MHIWMYVDQYSSWSSNNRAEEWNEDHSDEQKTGKDLEYEEIEKLFSKAFPAEKLTFKRDVLLSELRNGNPDIYVWDIGGLCYVDQSGTQRYNWSHEVVRQIEDHPGTVFVPWSAFTQRYVRGALEDLIGEDAFEAQQFPRNILILDENELLTTTAIEQDIVKRVREIIA